MELKEILAISGQPGLYKYERLTSLQFIIRGVWIDGRNNTKGSHVIYLEGKAEVANHFLNNTNFFGVSDFKGSRSFGNSLYKLCFVCRYIDVYKRQIIG